MKVPVFFQAAMLNVPTELIYIALNGLPEMFWKQRASDQQKKKEKNTFTVWGGPCARCFSFKWDTEGFIIFADVNISLTTARVFEHKVLELP